MPLIPDFADERYRNEVGWFRYREKYGYNHWTGNYHDERHAWSGMLLDEFLELYHRPRQWIEDKAVVSVGSGCTGDMTSWPCAGRTAIDPLLYTHLKPGMLADDAPGTPHNEFRDYRVFLAAHRKPRPMLSLDQESILQAYEKTLDL